MQLNYGAAVNRALHRALTMDPTVIVFGEDVARPGGVFGATRGLRDRFGDRVFDTPISEAAITGAGIGAAILGRRPVIEIMFMDFMLQALDQLVNQAANVSYLSRGKLRAPITIRTQQGFIDGSCAQHSQCLEAMLAHVPGLRVAVPATPQDAYSMLLTAISDDNPVVVIENRSLYDGLPRDVEVDGPIEPVGGSRVEQPGHDVTVAAVGSMVGIALEAAEVLAKTGISAEVVNLRWVSPLDVQGITNSVRKTGRLVVVHEANQTGGIGAEVATAVGREAFGDILVPIERVAARDVRVPAAPSLQAAVLPSTERLIQVVQKVCSAPTGSRAPAN